MSCFKVRAFAGGRHRSAPAFTLLSETTHTTEVSAYVEIEALRERMLRGEVARAELIDQRVGGELTCLNVYNYTPIPWSWTKG